MKNHRKPLSRFFPAYHPKAGQDFILQSGKYLLYLDDEGK